MIFIGLLYQSVVIRSLAADDDFGRTSLQSLNTPDTACNASQIVPYALHAVHVERLLQA